MLSALTAIVAVEPDDSGEALVRALQRERASVVRAWPPPESFPADVSVIIAAYEAQLHRRLPWVPGEAAAALVVVLPQNGDYNIGALRNCGPDGLLFRPIQAGQVATTTLLAWDHFQYFRRLSTRIARLEENIRAARDIERAKTIVAALHKIDDEAAYAFLRRRAMERRISISALAMSIIDSHGLLDLA